MVMEIFQGFAKRLLQMDQEGAARVIDALKSYLETYDSKRDGSQTIQSYTEFRINNVGFWYVDAPPPNSFLNKKLIVSCLG